MIYSIRNYQSTDCNNNYLPLINNRLSSLSSTEEEFIVLKEDYEQALKETGHSYEMKFEENSNAGNSKKKQKPQQLLV